ncbi:hypothetical protein [Dactylosporangium sp. NPDC048998]|uniref:hypothetical protein n=1 Tax=Dactylosporangium sp. NPDC048998 TaxID=3363976 RepID=UPI0037217D7C
MTNVVLQTIGWIGSALLVVSLLQSRMLTLRFLNLIAAVVLVGYNAALLVWPMVAMNVAVAIIDIGHLIAIGRRRRRATAADEVSPIASRTSLTSRGRP